MINITVSSPGIVIECKEPYPDIRPAVVRIVETEYAQHQADYAHIFKDQRG